MSGVSCDRCGRARSLVGDLVRVAIAFERRITVERELCRPCADHVLDGMGTALGSKEKR